MKERPIIFSGAMVRAILEGRKTQTRRVCSAKLQEKFADYREYWHGEDGKCFSITFGGYHGGGGERVTRAMLAERFCPYGAPSVERRPNDRLWVRETWVELLAVSPQSDEPLHLRPGDVLLEPPTSWIDAAGRTRWHYDARIVSYRADGELEFCDGDGFSGELADRGDMPRWRPSIHMPRWASRITLEITNVRVERLQDISEEDAKAEGCRIWKGVPGDGEMSATQAFVRLWDSINGKKPGRTWRDNPWVWVIEFRRTS